MAAESPHLIHVHCITHHYTCPHCEQRFKSLKEPHSVRWLSLTRAIDSIYSNWPSLVDTTNGLLAQIKAFKFVAIMHMLLNVLPILDSLSRSFQLENVFICTLKPRVTGEAGLDGPETRTWRGTFQA